jgi:zinc D-Ala-D-Ala carboxypeptidase
MQLTDHFSLEELITSDFAVRHQIDNSPSADIVANLHALAAGLERVRAALGGKPIHVNSGFRCKALNTALKGAPDSMHMRGLAADILCPQFGSPLDVCRAIAGAGFPTDEIIHEFGQWTHVAFAAPGTAPRSKLLTIAHDGQGYQLGLNAIA